MSVMNGDSDKIVSAYSMIEQTLEENTQLLISFKYIDRFLQNTFSEKEPKLWTH